MSKEIAQKVIYVYFREDKVLKIVCEKAHITLVTLSLADLMALRPGLCLRTDQHTLVIHLGIAKGSVFLRCLYVTHIDNHVAFPLIHLD